MNVSVEGPFRSLRSPLFLKIEQRIGIKVSAKDMEAPFGDAWGLQALQFVAQRAVAPLRRIEIGKPSGWIRRGGRFSQGDAGVDDIWSREDERRDTGRHDARPARLRGIGDHRGSDGRFGFGNRVGIKAGPQIVG